MMWAKPLAIIPLILLSFRTVDSTDSDLEFIFEPSSRLVKVSDGRAVFRCSALPATAEIRWLFRGQPIHHNRWIRVSGHKLTVHFGRMDKNSKSYHHLENGYFQCEIRLKGRVLVSSPAKLILAVLEQFPAQADVHIAAIYGNTALIPCDPPYSVPTVITEFTFNGTLIDKSTDNQRLMPSGDLQIFNVKYEDSGEYICVANNPFLAKRTESKRKVFLHVEEPSVRRSPSFVKFPQSKLSVTLGSNVTLECVANGYPVPIITWRRQHGKLHPSRYQQIGGNLQIIGVRRADEDTYFCEAENSVGRKISTETVIEVQETPQIMRHSKSMFVETGENITLHCASRGNPKPVLTWLHNGRTILTDQESKSKGSHLVLQNVSLKHSGIYQCFASNDLGTVYASFVVSVTSANKSLDLDYDMDDYDDDTGNTPTSHYEKGRGLNNADQNSGEERSHSGKDSVSEFSTETLHKRPHKKKHPKGVKLVPPSRPDVTRLSNTSVMVRWSVPRNDGLPILFFKVQYKEVGRRSHDWMTIDEDIAAHIHSYAVTNLRTGGTYRFQIAAVYSNNDNKSGPISAKFVLYKDPPMEKPSVGPIITFAEAASPSAITLHWDYEDIDSVPIEGFFIHYRATHSAGKYFKITVLGANTRSHIISHLLPDTGYDIKMQCFNIAGTSDFSNIYTCKTKASEVITGTRNRNSKSHYSDDGTVSMTEPVSSKNSQGNFMLYIGLSAGLGLIFIVSLVCFVVYLRQRQNRQQTCDTDSGRDDSLKLGNGYISANGYIPVSNKINISVNPLSHLDADDSEKPEDLEDMVSNNNEIIRLQTFSVNAEPHQDPVSEAEMIESTFNGDDKTAAVILPSDSGASTELPEKF